MKKENVVILSLVNGEKIIGEKSNSANGDFCNINEPRLINLTINPMTGRAGVALIDIDAPFASEPTKLATFRVEHIIRTTCNINDELLNSYLSSVSGIAIPSSSDKGIII